MYCERGWDSHDTWCWRKHMKWSKQLQWCGLPRRSESLRRLHINHVLVEIYCRSHTLTEHDRIRTPLCTRYLTQNGRSTQLLQLLHLPNFAGVCTRRHGLRFKSRDRSSYCDAPRRRHTRTAPPPPPKRVRTLQTNVLEKELKGLSLLGENYGDSFEKMIRKCCETVAKVLRKCCGGVAETSQRLVQKCFEIVANVFAEYRGVLRKCFESTANMLRKCGEKCVFVARAVFKVLRS